MKKGRTLAARSAVKTGHADAAGDGVPGLARAVQAPVYDPEGQAQRRRRVYDFLLPYVRPHFVLEDDTLTDRFPHPTDKRLRLWIATALLAGDQNDRALGDAIIRGLHFTHACHFCMAATSSWPAPASPRGKPR